MADPILDSFDAPAFSIDGEAYVLRGIVDPSAGAGVAAPSSSLFLRRAVSGVGHVYLKTGALDTDWVDISSSAGGTVTSVGAVQPSEGLTISGGPVTTTGSFTFALANDLAALEGLTGTGFAARTNTDVWAQRQLTSSNNTLSIVNPAGVAGNPSIDLPAVGTAISNSLCRITTDAYGRVSASSTPQATDLSMATSRLLGRTTAGAGSVEEITVGSGLTLVGGVLSNIGASVVKRVWQGSVTSASGTSNITPGTTPPPISGGGSGSQIWSQVITPTTIADKYTINVALSVSCGTANATVTIALFRNSTYIGSAIELDAGSLRTHQIAFIIPDSPATTSAVTYSMRIGTSAGTWYVNRRAAENTYGGAKSGWSIFES